MRIKANDEKSESCHKKDATTAEDSMFLYEIIPKSLPKLSSLAKVTLLWAALHGSSGSPGPQKKKLFCLG